MRVPRAAIDIAMKPLDVYDRYWKPVLKKLNHPSELTNSVRQRLLNTPDAKYVTAFTLHVMKRVMGAKRFLLATKRQKESKVGNLGPEF